MARRSLLSFQPAPGGLPWVVSGRHRHSKAIKHPYPKEFFAQESEDFIRLEIPRTLASKALAKVPYAFALNAIVNEKPEVAKQVGGPALFSRPSAMDSTSLQTRYPMICNNCLPNSQGSEFRDAPFHITLQLSQGVFLKPARDSSFLVEPMTDAKKNARTENASLTTARPLD